MLYGMLGLITILFVVSSIIAGRYIYQRYRRHRQASIPKVLCLRCHVIDNVDIVGAMRRIIVRAYLTNYGWEDVTLLVPYALVTLRPSNCSTGTVRVTTTDKLVERQVLITVHLCGQDLLVNCVDLYQSPPDSVGMLDGMGGWDGGWDGWMGGGWDGKSARRLTWVV